MATQAVSTSQTLASLGPLTLAYVGDAVWELAVREHLLEQGLRKPRDLHRRAVDFVSAAGQARRLRAIAAELSVEELEVVRRGRNAKGHVPKSASVADYHAATGVETLLAHLYLTRQSERLAEVLQALIAVQDESGAAGTVAGSSSPTLE
ncbi:MAG: ribonuclease III [Firmicutes bacterium]|nr:ribonuclease III [Bacillota bacterium]